MALLLWGITSWFTADYFFSNSDAKKLLAQHQLEPHDDFKIVYKHSGVAPGEYFEEFTISITSSDKQRLINEIRQSRYFVPAGQQPADFHTSRHTPTKTILQQDYEDQFAFIREYAEILPDEPPVYHTIYIYKKDNTMQYHESDE
ncbi:hypothetical protein [Chitinophaga sp. Cy-1792]|uniref:hypothetical protein n=1 Tax=Chitinophaga sp. Cy-1792 TaxID=2608339 RepID=UPI00141F7AFF|nr:hypothetical protein [Chitinophaga sp. Cy-1792]NIG57700.1 hypothetical protein [Chitinophaga sp. Cy-1792]